MRQDRLKSLFDDSEISGVHESRPEGNNIDMKLRHTVAILLAWLFILKGGASSTETETPATDPPRAFINGQGPGWVTLGEKDFADVNGDEDTWVFDGTLIKGSGVPIGVMRTAKQYKNFELVLEWRHNKSAGNSGVFVWVDEKRLEGLQKGNLPGSGIEIQALDHGYAEEYKKRTGNDPDWFTTHGDIFAVGTSTMSPFPPLSPNGSRSFPRTDRSKGVGEWNHYYVRAMNGEVRLWVNGEEVSGGNECKPSSGYLCLEAEGSPIDFRDIRIRELP